MSLRARSLTTWPLAWRPDPFGSRAVPGWAPVSSGDDAGGPAPGGIRTRRSPKTDFFRLSSRSGSVAFRKRCLGLLIPARDPDVPGAERRAQPWRCGNPSSGSGTAASKGTLRGSHFWSPCSRGVLSIQDADFGGLLQAFQSLTTPGRQGHHAVF